MIDGLLTTGGAFAEQVQSHRAALYRVAYSWCHDAGLADDLVQESLLKALSRSAQLRDAARLRSWLFSILGNCFRDHLRARRVHDDVEALDEELVANGPSPEEACAGAQVAARVRAAVEQLPLGQRQVLTLVDLEEFGYAEVAEILGIPIGTVMSRLCRARAALRLSLLPTATVIELRPARRAG